MAHKAKYGIGGISGGLVYDGNNKNAFQVRRKKNEEERKLVDAVFKSIARLFKEASGTADSLIEPRKPKVLDFQEVIGTTMFEGRQVHVIADRNNRNNILYDDVFSCLAPQLFENIDIAFSQPVAPVSGDIRIPGAITADRALDVTAVFREIARPNMTPGEISMAKQEPTLTFLQTEPVFDMGSPGITNYWNNNTRQTLLAEPLDALNNPYLRPGGAGNDAHYDAKPSLKVAAANEAIYDGVKDDRYGGLGFKMIANGAPAPAP